MAPDQASENGLGAEGEPIAGGATPKDGWPVGRSVAHRPAGESEGRPKLVDALTGASADAGSIPAASTERPVSAEPVGARGRRQGRLRAPAAIKTNQLKARKRGEPHEHGRRRSRPWYEPPAGTILYHGDGTFTRYRECRVGRAPHAPQPRGQGARTTWLSPKAADATTSPRAPPSTLPLRRLTPRDPGEPGVPAGGGRPAGHPAKGNGGHPGPQHDPSPPPARHNPCLRHTMRSRLS